MSIKDRQMPQNTENGSPSFILDNEQTFTPAAKEPQKKKNPLAIAIPIFVAVCIALCITFYQIGSADSASHYQEKYNAGYESGSDDGYAKGKAEGYDIGFNAAKEKFVKPVAFEQGKVYVKPSASCVAPFTVSTANTDTYIFLDYTNDKCDIGFCVKGGTTYKRNVPLGDCKLYYATGGDAWYGTTYGTDYCFGNQTTWNTSDDTFSFTADSQYYYGHKVTLYKVENGNFDTYYIPSSDLPF